MLNEELLNTKKGTQLLSYAQRLCGVVFVVLPVVAYMLDWIGFNGSVKSKWRNKVVIKKLLRFNST